MGANYRSGEFSCCPNMAFAYAVKTTLVYKIHPEERKHLMMLTA
jgi:hypothetical protein